VVGIGSTSSPAAPPCAHLDEAFGERGPGRVPTIRVRRMVRRIDRRFGTGVPRVSDGSRLFLLHLVSKMRPTKVGYEIPFNRHFYVFKPQRPLAAIDADLKVVTDKIRAMLEELSQ
jgi:hypothetical protein